MAHYITINKKGKLLAITWQYLYPKDVFLFLKSYKETTIKSNYIYLNVCFNIEKNFFEILTSYFNKNFNSQVLKFLSKDFIQNIIFNNKNKKLNLIIQIHNNWNPVCNLWFMLHT